MKSVQIWKTKPITFSVFKNNYPNYSNLNLNEIFNNFCIVLNLRKLPTWKVFKFKKLNLYHFLYSKIIILTIQNINQFASRHCSSRPIVQTFCPGWLLGPGQKGLGGPGPNLDPNAGRVLSRGGLPALSYRPFLPALSSRPVFPPFLPALFFALSFPPFFFLYIGWPLFATEVDNF
jgi:hypothetical protein